MARLETHLKYSYKKCMCEGPLYLVPEITGYTV